MPAGSENATSHLSVRIPERDKAALVAAAAECGVEPSVAIRQVVDLMARRFEAGADFWDVMREMKAALQGPRPSEIERRIAAVQRALAEWKPADAQEGLLEQLDELERQLIAVQRTRAGKG